MSIPILALCVAVLVGDGEGAASRLKAICDRYATAPSVTFEMNLPPLVRLDAVGEFGEKGRVGRPDRKTLVLRREAGKPEHLTTDGAELFRFESGVLVGRLSGGEWRRLEVPAKPASPGAYLAEEDATALDRLVHAAGVLRSPCAWLKQVRDEIGEAEERERKDGGRSLEAWLNGHRPMVPKGRDEGSPPREGVENTHVGAHLRPDGSVESFTLGRSWLSSKSDGLAGGGSASFRLTPTDWGATSVEVPPEVTALAAK